MNRPLRVMYVEPSALVTGGAIALLRVVEALDKRDVKPLVVLGSDGPLVDRFRQIADCDVLCRPLPAGLARVTRFGVASGGLANILPAIAYGLALRRIADRWQADIVHSNGLKTHVLTALTVRRRRILIWHIRDVLSASYMSPRSAAVMRRLARLIPDVTICVSQSTRAALTDGAGEPSRPLHTVFDGIRCDPDAAARGATPRGGYRVLMLGRIAEWKGQHVFIRAAQRLCTDDHETQFMIAGGATNAADAEYERQLHASVESAGLSERVAFAGVVTDVGALLRTVDLVVHCSTSPEPFGLVIIEAMAASVPVVATNLGGPAEVIRNDVNGRLYPAGDDGALATVVKELLGDATTRRRLAYAARRTVEERFEIQHTVRELAAIYRRYAGNGKV